LKNNIGLHYGYWLNDWDGNLVKIIEKIHKIGFSAVEFDSDIMLKRTLKKRDDLSIKLAQYNLSINFCIGMNKKHDISSENSKTRERGINHVKEIIKMVNNMGGDTLSGVCYGEWSPSLDKAKNKTDYLKRSIDSVKQIMIFAEKYGVNYNIEPVNRYEQFMINTCEEALSYIDEVNSPNLKILLDTYHMNIEEDNMEKAILEAGNKLGHFHIGENNRKPPGEGSIINWDNIFEALKKIEYKGDIVMEPFINYGGKIGFDTRLWRSMDSKNSDLEGRISNSLDFIKNKLK